MYSAFGSHLDRRRGRLAQALAHLDLEQPPLQVGIEVRAVDLDLERRDVL